MLSIAMHTLSAPLLQSLLDGTPSLPSDTNTKNTLRGRERNSAQMRSLRHGLSVAADPSGMLSSSLNKSISNSTNSQQSRYIRLQKSRSSGSISKTCSNSGCRLAVPDVGIAIPDIDGSDSGYRSGRSDANTECGIWCFHPF